MLKSHKNLTQACVSFYKSVRTHTAFQFSQIYSLNVPAVVLNYIWNKYNNVKCRKQ